MRGQTIWVDDPSDPRLALYRNLTDVKLRRATDAAHGVFLAEGKLVVRRLAESGHAIHSVFLAANRTESLADVIASVDAPIYVGPPGLLEATTGFNIHRGVLAIGERPPAGQLDSLLEAARTLAIVEDVTDHENLGALARSAHALGIDGLVLSPGCCDPLSRRALRVSMGTLLDLPHVRVTTWPADLDILKRRGFVLWALTPAGRIDLQALRPPERVAMMFGTEGAGLSQAAMERADASVAIPVRTGTDSLNVAAAAAIVFHHLGRVGHSSPD